VSTLLTAQPAGRAECLLRCAGSSFLTVKARRPVGARNINEKFIEETYVYGNFPATLPTTTTDLAGASQPASQFVDRVSLRW